VLPPQLLEANELSTASDVYSFGIIMYEVLTFKIPFEECTKALVRLCCLSAVILPCSRCSREAPVSADVSAETLRAASAIPNLLREPSPTCASHFTRTGALSHHGKSACRALSHQVEGAWLVLAVTLSVASLLVLLLWCASCCFSLSFSASGCNPGDRSPSASTHPEL
jgi:serine/threonine protein kinase